MGINWTDLAAGGQGFGSLISSIGGLILGGESNKIEQANFDWQKSIDRRNFAYEQENQSYQRGLQQTMFDREDSAVQRRAADLEAAGMSKVLAAGQGAQAGPVVNSTAPQQHAAQRGISGKVAQMQAITGFANIAKTMAETSLIESQAESAKAQSRFDIRRTNEILGYDDKSKRQGVGYFESLADSEKLTAKAREHQEWAKSTLAEIDAEWKREMANRIKSMGLSNPMQIEYLTARAYEKIRAVDAEYAEELKKITAGSTTTKALMPLIQMLFGKDFK